MRGVPHQFASFAISRLAVSVPCGSLLARNAPSPRFCKILVFNTLPAKYCVHWTYSGMNIFDAHVCKVYTVLAVTGLICKEGFGEFFTRLAVWSSEPVVIPGRVPIADKVRGCTPMIHERRPWCELDDKTYVRAGNPISRGQFYNTTEIAKSVKSVPPSDYVGYGFKTTKVHTVKYAPFDCSHSVNSARKRNVAHLKVAIVGNCKRSCEWVSRLECVSIGNLDEGAI